MLDLPRLAEVLKALGDSTRLTIIALLNHRDCCVCELVPIFNISQPAISKHLSRLKSAGLVTETRRGQWVFYALNRKQLEQVGLSLNNLPDVSDRFAALAEQGKLVSCEQPPMTGS
ncbi:metalloregulator ArsR/SmtB family transcription factor [Brevibacillus humidisoli]|uniref:ArsR/SmtB family transcription factor n=1 Tax=Brevibacillus humidisoli TaxID=2895522 RepID=UPI001E346D02|nr:metalloregulator ArsR/SmtB family transcription factor [Brevibacillus humidisoli]UFJ40503.1 metalloregulator ArsR/SmtB family transcription factor [Brevibacillus humidisoli]